MESAGKRSNIGKKRRREDNIFASSTNKKRRYRLFAIICRTILEMDDDAMQAPLLFMKKDDKHESLYFWPTDDDISWESYSQILVV